MKDSGILNLSELQWENARKRFEIIKSLSELPSATRQAAGDAAITLGVSRRQIYEFLKRFRNGNDLLTDFAPKKSNGGRGKSRISKQAEAIISSVLQDFYLSRQRLSEAVVFREVLKRCRQAGCSAPARNTIRNRIGQLDPKIVSRKRNGWQQSRGLEPVVGEPPQTSSPLDLVQVDHTKVDLIVVEEITRQPIGRPYLTLAIDIHTRCILGMYLSLEAPSATSVGLCLANAISAKCVLLEELGLSEVSWSMQGKPRKLHMDNAAEFKSYAFKRGCEQHGIERDYRPKKQPQFGGVIERIIGTAMKRIHELPGTTFSDPEERGSYDSESKAILTMHELERWLVLAISIYHESVHGTLKQTPSAVWDRAMATHSIKTISNPQTFLIDFLPIYHRRIGRSGFVLDHVCYYADFLKPWIARREVLDRFVIRRDPRDLSRIWVLDPNSSEYLEVAYRTINNPSVTLWEHRHAIRLLREGGRKEVNESAIFQMIDKMREITESAAIKSKRARRDRARTSHLTKQMKDLNRPEFPAVEDEECTIGIFEDIEEW